MIGLKPKPVEHQNLLQPFIEEIGETGHVMRFNHSYYDHFFHADDPRSKGKKSEKNSGQSWHAETELPSGLRYTFTLDSDIQRDEETGNDHPRLTMQLNLRHPDGQRQRYFWNTSGVNRVISQKRVATDWRLFKTQRTDVQKRDMESKEVKKLIALAKRFGTRENLPLHPRFEGNERERVRLSEGIKNLRTK